MPSGATLLIINPPDTPNTGRYKINYNFSILAFSSFTGISASKFTNPNPTTQTVGGIYAGSTFGGDYYLQDMMDLLLYPAVTPNFTSFLISAQATQLEVGATVAGSKTFTWLIANTADLQPNSISIEDTTNSTVLATGLADDGTETVFLSSVSKTSPASNIWTISAQDTDSNVFTRTYAIDWMYAVFFGISASLTLNAAAIVALAGSSLENDVNGSYTLAGSGYGYICVPNSFSVPNGFRDSTTNLPIDMAGTIEGYTSFDGAFFYDSVSVTRNGVPIIYRVYRTKNSISSSTIAVAVTGGTVATLQSVINAGNTATGNASILGNFSATTYYSGSTPLNTILSNLGAGTATYVQPGSNITTGGTQTNPIINVVGSPVFTSVTSSSVFSSTLSGGTLYSGSTELGGLFSSVFAPISVVNTYVQPGLNISTGGTSSSPVVNVVGSPVFTSVTSSSIGSISISATTFYSAGTDINYLLGGFAPTIDEVLETGHIAVGKNLVINSNGVSGGSVFFGANHTFDESNPNNISGSTLLGGLGNTLSGVTYNSHIVGGTNNIISDSYLSTILGGSFNSTISNATQSTIFCSPSALIREGSDGTIIINSPSSSASTLAYNTSILGGGNNLVQYEDTGGFATILGSSYITISGINNNYVLGASSSELLGSRSSSFIGGSENHFNGAVNAISISSSRVNILLSENISVINSNDVTSDYSYASSIIGAPYSTIMSAGSATILGAISGQIIGATEYDSTLSGASILGGFENYISGSSIGAVIIGGANNILIHSGSTILGGHDQISDAIDTVFMMNAKVSSGLYSNSVSAVTFYSGSTNLNYLLGNGGASTYVQPGLNTFTGGTIASPTVNVVGSPIFTAVTATSISGTSISATTFYSGSTPIQGLFSLSAHTHLSSHITDSSYGGNGSSDFNKLAKFGPFGNMIFVGTGSTPAINVFHNSLFSEDAAISATTIDSIAIKGESTNGDGGHFESINGRGVDAASENGSGIVGRSIGSYGGEFFSENGLGAFVYSYNNIGIFIHGLSNLGALIKTSDSGNTFDIANFTNISDEGLNINNDGGLQWTSPTGSATTRYNLGIVDTYVQPGSNITTGGTQNAPTVNLVASPSVFNLMSSGVTYATTLSGNTIYSGTSELGGLLAQTYAPISVVQTYVRPGLNITTGGTPNAPIVNLAGGIALTSVTFSSFIRDGGANIDGGIYYKSPSTTMMTASASYMLDSTMGLVRYLFAGTASGAYTPTGGFTGATLQASSSIKSGTTDLGAIFAPISVVPTYVQPGLNTTTGGTIARPIVNVAGSIVLTGITASVISGTSVSATTFSSGGTELSVALANKFNSTYAPISAVQTYLQNGTNTSTGGTVNTPSVNLNSDIALGSISASTVTASTFYVSSIAQANIQSVRLATTFVTSSSTYVDITGLSFPLEANSNYEFRFLVNFKSQNVNAGFGLSVNGPSAPAQLAAVMLGHQAAGTFIRFISAYDDGTGAATSLASNTSYASTMSGVITTTAAGTLTARMLRNGSAFNLSAMTGSAGILTKLS